MGVQSICIKDMAGIMGPQEGYDLVKALKENVKVPIVVHTHCTTGLGPLTLQKAVEAGADVIDTAISCFSGGTAQPATETLAYALRQEGYEVSLDDKKLKEINDFFKPIRAQALESGLFKPRSALHRDRRAGLSGARRHALQPCRPTDRAEIT